MIHEAHAFRGEYIDLCAQIERWATAALRSEDAVATGKVKAKQPYLFGQKLKLIRELAEANMVFAKPGSVRDLMIALEPFAKLRSDLAHAIVRVAEDAVGTAYTFDLANTDPGTPELTRFWFTPAETDHRLGQLRKLKKLILDQKIRSSS